ncbi:MAG: hypothetical protein ACI80P_001692 [Flavobacteriales bacterium]
MAYALKNNNLFPIRFELVDQLPISQTMSAEVELEKRSNGKIDATSGDVTWLVDLKPGQAENRELIYTIEIDANFQYKSAYSKKRVRIISCPSFKGTCGNDKRKRHPCLGMPLSFRI